MRVAVSAASATPHAMARPAFDSRPTHGNEKHDDG